MTDIVKRLRLLQKHQQDNDAGEAADTIDALRAENARLIEERYVEGWNDAIANSEAVTDLRAENARLKAELAEYKRNGIVDVTGSINYHSGYDDGLEAAAKIAETPSRWVTDKGNRGCDDIAAAIRAARAAMGDDNEQA